MAINVRKLNAKLTEDYKDLKADLGIGLNLAIGQTDNAKDFLSRALEKPGNEARIREQECFLPQRCSLDVQRVL